MRRLLVVLSGCLLLAALPVQGQNKGTDSLPFKIIYDSAKDLKQFDKDGKLMLKVSFGIERIKGKAGEPGVIYKILVIEEPDKENKVQAEYTVPMTSVEGELAVVMVMDTSGSMAEQTVVKDKKMTRMDQAKNAANVFFNSLPPKADTGLVLFHHTVYHVLPVPTPRQVLQAEVNQAKPDGGTAYFDATARAIGLLKDLSGKQKAVVLMTDGVDLNSILEEDMIIDMANRAGVKVFTIGIGKPGKMEPVTTVLVLDKSGSMKLPASDRKGERSKIEALRSAAKRFVNIVGNNKRCAVMQFGDTPEMPSPFLNDKKQLADLVAGIREGGETCLFDAVYDAILTLDVEGNTGKRAVVALTDGIDNKSRRRVDEIIKTAKDAKIQLFLLGFGRPGELDIDTMSNMARSTGGEFYHADSEDKLIRLFEDLSNKIHDDGINEVSLRKIAAATGGNYYPAEDVKDLHFIVKQVAKEIQDETRSFTFPSVRQVRDGLSRTIDLKPVKVTKEGKQEDIGSTVGGGRVNVRGVVIAQMDHFVYLILLVLLGILIALPSLMKRKQAA